MKPLLNNPEWLFNLNWWMSCLVVIVIAILLICNLWQLKSYKIRPLFRKRGYALVLFLSALAFFLTRMIPIREGYDNFHGFDLNQFSMRFKEVVPGLILSNLNLLSGFRMEAMFVFNYLLAILCGLLLGLIIFLRIKDIFAGALASILLILSPASLILIKTISSAHLNSFFFLLALFMLTLFNYLLSAKKGKPKLIFIILILLIPLSNNIRQEYLIFLCPFILETAYRAIKSGFFSKNRIFCISSVIISLGLFILFYLYQVSLQHRNYPKEYLNLHNILWDKFQFLNSPANFLIGILAFASILILLFRKQYFFSLALFLWILFSSNIYNYSFHNCYPLQFLRHELYLSLPYIVGFSIVIAKAAHWLERNFSRMFFSTICFAFIVSYLAFSALALTETKNSLRTCDYLLEFFHDEIAKLPASRILIMPGVQGDYPHRIFSYLSSMYHHKRCQPIALAHGEYLFFASSKEERASGYIIYYPEICGFLEYAGNKKCSCREFSSFYLGRVISLKNFIHKYNITNESVTLEIPLTVGFYEPSEKFCDIINQNAK